MDALVRLTTNEAGQLRVMVDDHDLSDLVYSAQIHARQGAETQVTLVLKAAALVDLPAELTIAVNKEGPDGRVRVCAGGGGYPGG